LQNILLNNKNEEGHIQTFATVMKVMALK